MPILKASAIAKLRRVANLHFPDLATIYEEPLSTATRNASGGIDKTFPTAWTTIGTDIPCRLSSTIRDGEEVKSGGKPYAEKRNYIYFASGQAVSVTCRIKVTSLKRYKPGDDPDDNSAWDSPIFDVIIPQIVSNELQKKVEVKERF